MSATTATGNYAHVNGIKMYYEIHGSGSPLVLIHGGGSTLYTTFGRIMPMLAQTHQIIGVELQAHGHTQDRDTHSSFEQDADDVAELLKQLNVTGANVIGFSNGGTTAMALAIRHPDRVRKLVLASALYKRSGMPPWFWDFMMNSGGLDSMPQVYKDEYLKINPDDHKGLNAMHDRDAYRMQTFVDWSVDSIRSIQQPSLVVAGDQDIITVEHTIEMYRLLPHGRLAILPANHGSYLGEIMTPDTGSKMPALFVAMVEEFLAAPMPEG
ncbi:alpha/beta hydrolase [Flavipsychrobacter stenotrophus]|uniref:Alpha/beta hydrolase n=1 Tax=Flavipsychrobacter stenotrophus TaxID=2077091 RepID=A0A2S7SZN4_9BACT|nr:alpha/beta hydrolase [Flavipsychrobacter stenotrophus]PQJ12071.1 alpha/beta hydrolase [Flavipsychrobacter stenotrophus]